MQHVFIVGAKGFTYGGYETFLDKLTEYHQGYEEIKYHIACKANGAGLTDETKLQGAQIISDTEYVYHNAHCFKIQSPDLGTAQAILYDIKALRYCCSYIKKNKIQHPIIYVLSSRVGPVMGYFAGKIHKLGGKYYNNPDGWKDIIWLNQKTPHKYSVLTA
jgi:rhamnosyltransferase